MDFFSGITIKICKQSLFSLRHLMTKIYFNYDKIAFFFFSFEVTGLVMSNFPQNSIDRLLQHHKK